MADKQPGPKKQGTKPTTERGAKGQASSPPTSKATNKGRAAKEDPALGWEGTLNVPGEPSKPPAQAPGPGPTAPARPTNAPPARPTGPTTGPAPASRPASGQAPPPRPGPASQANPAARLASAAKPGPPAPPGPPGGGAAPPVQRVAPRKAAAQRPGAAAPPRRSQPPNADSRDQTAHAGKPGPALSKTSVHGAPPTKAIPHDGPSLISVPPVPQDYESLSVSTLVPGRIMARMLRHRANRSLLYEVIEPVLSESEHEAFVYLRDTLVKTLDGRNPSDEEPEKVLSEAVRQAAKDHSVQVDEQGLRRVEYQIFRDFLGYGPVEALMRDPMIEDISCDGPGIPVYLFHREYESVRTSIVFADELDLDSFVIRLAQRSGKHISIAEPLLDATLPDGSRLQATLSREVTTRGSSFTIRKFRADPMTPSDLVRLQTMSSEMAAYFWFAMESGRSFIIAGGTASGKTTSLNAICQFIPPEKKIVSIEDTREINLSHENWIAGLTRSGFGGEVGSRSAGTIDMYKLLEAALRQRPEYLVVGEVRGPEALTLFQAMATGHAVYSTMHADSAPSAVYRLENPPINVPRIMLQTLDIIAIQTQARVGDRLVRRLREVVEVVGFDPETEDILTNTVFQWDQSQDRIVYLGKSTVLETFMALHNRTEAQVDAEWKRRVRVLQWMEAQGIRHYADFARIIHAYYRDPQSVLRQMEAKNGPA